MVHSPAREGIAKAVSGRLKTDHIDMLQNNSYDFDSAKQSGKYIPFRKEHLSNNTSIAAAARQEQRLRQDAEASTAEQSTGLSASKNTLIKKGYISNTLTSRPTGEKTRG